MVPVLALSALGVIGVVQRSRDAGAMSGVVTQVERVTRTLHLYAGLVAEKTGSESIVVAAALHISPDQVAKLAGYDVEARLRSARAAVDAAIADGAGPILGKKVPRLVALRAQIDAGAARETTVRSFFIDSIDAAESEWRAQLDQLTQTSFNAGGSAAIRRAIAGLADAVDAFISGAKETTAAGALTVPGVPGASTGATDLAAANAVYARATAGLGVELGGPGAAAWRHLIVNDPDVKTFQRFLGSLLRRPSGAAAGTNIAEIAQTFRPGLIFQDHLREVVDAAAAEIVPLARALRTDARRALQRYLLVMGIIAACSAAGAAAIARKIVRPLHRLAARASELSAGVINRDPLDTSGPHDIASVSAAFNEIVANLTALDAKALALAAADLDNPALATSVPGRIGNSMQRSVDLLQRSIRDNEELHRNLQANEARFRDLADKSPDIILRFSREPEPHFEYLSPSFEALTGISPGDVEADFAVFLAALDAEGRAWLADAASGRPIPARFDSTFRRKDGTLAVFELRVAEAPGGLHAAGRDVTEIRALQAQLAEQAARDPLTGLANRRLLDELLGRALHRAERSGSALTVAFLDLDNFKSVNDTYGHDAGDTVLRATAARLETALRGADVVARYGGDEFVVVYEDADDDAGRRLADRIDDALRAPIDVGSGVAIRCSPSIGIADTRSTARNPAALIGAADRAMFDIKKTRVQSPRHTVRLEAVCPVE